ncbi:RNA polymerase II-associated protein 1 [Apis mellifera carnica]|nr:RNA polymerase II-associated protein 1 [Apis mellifera carnica]
MKNDKSQSLFWQQISPNALNRIKEFQKSEFLCISDKSVIVEGSWANEIHKENLERLKQMSQEDILKEKSKLEITLKPELVQFLRDKRIKKQKINKIQESDEISNNEAQDQNINLHL